jgi:hypothetical protein
MSKIGKMIAFIEGAYPNNAFNKIDGYDDAIIGVERHSMNLCYSLSSIIKILMDRDKMTWEEATEFFEYNIESLNDTELPSFVFVDDDF